MELSCRAWDLGKGEEEGKYGEKVCDAKQLINNTTNSNKVNFVLLRYISVIIVKQC